MPDTLTLETAMFPVLFPGNTGFYHTRMRGGGGRKGYINLSEYVRVRASQLFSPFTLLQQYPLLLFQARGLPLAAAACSCLLMSHGLLRRMPTCAHKPRQSRMQHVLLGCALTTRHAPPPPPDEPDTQDLRRRDGDRARVSLQARTGHVLHA